MKHLVLKFVANDGESETSVELVPCGKLTGEHISKKSFMTLLYEARCNAGVRGAFKDLCNDCIRFTNTHRKDTGYLKYICEHSDLIVKINKYIKKHGIQKARTL